MSPMTDQSRSMTGRARHALVRALRGLATAIEPHPPATGGAVPPWQPRPDTVRVLASPGDVCTCRFRTRVDTGSSIRDITGCAVHDFAFLPGALTDT